MLVADIDPDRQVLDANRRRPVELEVPSFSSMDVAIGAVEMIAPIGASPPLITELAEMGVADHVLESISGHLSRRMLEHYSHIRIDAKRQALDALDVQRGHVLPGARNGNGGDPQNAEIKAIIDVSESVTSQSRHSLTLSGSPPHGKLLIPFERRDVRVVEGARLESVCRGNSTEGSNPSLSAN